MRPLCARHAVLLALAAGLAGGRGWGEPGDRGARIVQVREIAGGELPVAGGLLAVGGISDLYLETVGKGPERRLWAVTDRGPNGVVTVATRGREVKRRTMLAPEFVPSLIQLDASWLTGPSDDSRGGSVVVERVVPLKGRSGRPVSGRPNGLDRDETIHSPDGATRLADDTDGVDTEGVVATDDGGFWLVEEYRPSILRVAGDGTVLARHVPAGDSLPGAATDVIANLPARYARRARNRGFEAVAITPDGSRLFALLQSPLEPGPKARSSGSVPLLVFDTAIGQPALEREYVLDEADADGKLCAMAHLDASTLLVLEQADGGVARLYRVEVGDSPMRKTLVADLATLLPTMIADVHGDQAKSKRSLKIEGLAIVDPRHVLLANDNDFGVADARAAGEARDTTPKSCLWMIELPDALPLPPHT